MKTIETTTAVSRKQRLMELLEAGVAELEKLTAAAGWDAARAEWLRSYWPLAEQRVVVPVRTVSVSNGWAK